MKERVRALDSRLLWVILALVVLGTLTLYSAGRNTPQASIWLKQSVWMCPAGPRRSRRADWRD